MFVESLHDDLNIAGAIAAVNTFTLSEPSGRRPCC